MRRKYKLLLYNKIHFKHSFELLNRQIYSTRFLMMTASL